LLRQHPARLLLLSGRSLLARLLSGGALGSLLGRGAGEFVRRLHQVADRRIQANNLHLLALLACRHPLMMAIEHMPIARNEDRAVAAGVLGSLFDLVTGELCLRRLQISRRHGLLLVLHTSGIQEIDHRATVLSPDLWHFRTRTAQGARLGREFRPPVTDALTLDARLGDLLFRHLSLARRNILLAALGYGRR